MPASEPLKVADPQASVEKHVTTERDPARKRGWGD